MLIYHPIYDINHCLFRLLFLAKSSEVESIPWNTLRLMDFYYLFPHMLKKIQPFPRGYSSFSKEIKKIPDAYEAINNSKRVLFELEKIQHAAAQNLIAKGLFDVEDFSKMNIRRTEATIPLAIREAIEAELSQETSWMEFIVKIIPQLQFGGRSGLKFRSQLMEYRYDPV